MPELPEVETVMRGLAPHLTGAKLVEATARVPRLRFDIPENFSEKLIGNRVERLERRSKYILTFLADGLVMIVHLGMSGKFTIYEKGEQVPEIAKHDHIILKTEAGATIIYNDPRRFGMVLFSHDEELSDHSLIKDIGPEPLGNEFHDAILLDGLKGRRSPIKTMLLDQSLVAGLGNIYVCEVLWRSGIHPKRLSKDVSSEEIARIVPIVRTVLTDAIAAGGSSLNDYKQTNGELGYFQHSFKAYGREGEPCLKTGCDGTIERIVQSNRSTFFCATCQK